MILELSRFACWLISSGTIFFLGYSWEEIGWFRIIAGIAIVLLATISGIALRYREHGQLSIGESGRVVASGVPGSDPVYGETVIRKKNGRYIALTRRHFGFNFHPQVGDWLTRQKSGYRVDK